MFRFQHQEYFILLLLVGLAVLLYIFYKIGRKRKIALLGKEELVKDLIPSYHPLLSKIKFGLLAAALFFGVLAMANLQKRGKIEKMTQKGIDIMLALDISNSMFAQDVKPSRLGKAKLFASKLMDKMSGNRIGLILFAGRSYVSVPLTSDVAALKMNLSLASPEMAPTQGTVMGDALQMSYESFNSKDAKHKAIVMISDGEAHEDKAIREAKKIGKKGIMLCTVGVGSAEGSNILLPSGEIKKDRDGNEVLSKMNAKELKNVAESGQGIFVNLSNISGDVNKIANRLNQISKTNLGQSRLANYTSYFQYFLVLMLLLMLLEFFLPSRKSNKRLRTAFSVLLFLLIPQFLGAQTTDKNIYKGNQFYKKQEYKKAATAYEKTVADKKAKAKNPARFNLGNALLRAKDPEQALKQYEYVGVKAKDNKMSSYAFHNAGNVMAEQKKWQEAINYYKAALKKNPGAKQTQYNLAYAQKKLKQQQQQKKKDKDKKKDQDKDKDKKKQKEEDKKDDKKKEEPKDKDPTKKNESEKDKADEKNEGNQPKPKPSNMSKQQAKKILDALNRAEKKIKDKKAKQKTGNYRLDKDW
jgi:Ca-activated chloride channel family protein